MSNVIQTVHPEQDLKKAHDYRTLGKVSVIDGLYESLWNTSINNTQFNSAYPTSSSLSLSSLTNSNRGSPGDIMTTASSSQHSVLNKDDVTRLDFGNKVIWKTLDDEGNGSGCPGSPALERLLYALHRTVLGGVVDYAPLVPTLASILLGFMSESYAFYALREMFNQCTWYWAASLPEHVAYERAFCDVLQKLHPGTAAVMTEQDQVQAYCEAIFRDFFTTIWPESLCLRLMDIYTLEGSKVSLRNVGQNYIIDILTSIDVGENSRSHLFRFSKTSQCDEQVLFRFGVALCVLYGKEYKEKYMYESTDVNKWFIGLKDFCHNHLNFDILVKKAYGVHGKGVRKRFRFPRRPILARLIEMEEESYRKEQQEWALRRNDDSAAGDKSITIHSDVATAKVDDFFLQVEPLGLVIPPPPTDPEIEPVVPRLVTSTYVRTKLAEWLPLSLRFTKLDLVYSTSHHGRTLENLYRCVGNSTHTILLLEPFEDYGGDSHPKVVIGMYASQPWHPSSKVYGDGRSFLFRLVEDADRANGQKNASDGERGDSNGTNKDGVLGSGCWKWRPPNDLLDFGSSSNTMPDDPDDSILSRMGSTHSSSSSHRALLETFQISTKDFLSLGGNDHGGSGLRLNEDLTKGESSTAVGFENEPLLPACGGMFEVGLVEVYQLVRQMDGVRVK